MPIFEVHLSQLPASHFASVEEGKAAYIGKHRVVGCSSQA
jgi:hypothetical protein